jgi:hypothetical protein
MTEIIQQLAAIVESMDGPQEGLDRLPPNLQPSYCEFLSKNGGGYTKDHFFHFFGLGEHADHNLCQWNRVDYWKHLYGFDATMFVFAEDIFGTQFYFDIRANRRVIKMLMPASGKTSLCANTFEDFITSEVMTDESNLPVRSIADQFFHETGVPFRPFAHISCKIPICLGGRDANIGNLELVRSSAHLKILGQLLREIKGLPPGTSVKSVQADYEKEELKLVFAKPSLLKSLFKRS